MSTPTSRLGPVIAEAFRDAGLSENQAALRTGLHRETLRRYLKGGAIPTDRLGQIADALDIPMSELMARAEQVSA